MTKTEARRRATRHMTYGWFRDSATNGHLRCPDCRDAVGAWWPAWATPAQIRRELHAALTEHLLTEHEGGTS
jgi:hypothetical protein